MYRDREERWGGNRGFNRGLPRSPMKRRHPQDGFGYGDRPMPYPRQNRFPEPPPRPWGDRDSHRGPERVRPPPPSAFSMFNRPSNNYNPGRRGPMMPYHDRNPHLNPNKQFIPHANNNVNGNHPLSGKGMNKMSGPNEPILDINTRNGNPISIMNNNGEGPAPKMHHKAVSIFASEKHPHHHESQMDSAAVAHPPFTPTSAQNYSSRPRISAMGPRKRSYLQEEEEEDDLSASRENLIARVDSSKSDLSYGMGKDKDDSLDFEEEDEEHAAEKLHEGEGEEEEKKREEEEEERRST
eukprot:GCRY01005629.1.p1 GENE.GCRY01005629.1~~GCRY01005629.1.p1  ORF type:complete len:296 (+),score=37.57 GCRY01005629.1:118-1005(+)